MYSDIEQGDTSSSMVPYKKQTGIIEQNVSLEKELIIDQNILRFVLLSIDILENSFPNFIDFESHMSTIEIQNNYVMNYAGNDKSYAELISNLFRHDESIQRIQKKMEERFPIYTLDVITQGDVIDTQDVITMVLYDYSYPFVIRDETCLLQDKVNISLYNNRYPNVAELEDMKETFDDNNLYKCYNPNLIRNHGNVKIDQTLHCDYPRSVNSFTDVQQPPLKKRKTNKNRNVSKENK